MESICLNIPELCNLSRHLFENDQLNLNVVSYFLLDLVYRIEKNSAIKLCKHNLRLC